MRARFEVDDISEVQAKLREKNSVKDRKNPDNIKQRDVGSHTYEPHLPLSGDRIQMIIPYQNTLHHPNS